MELTHEQQVRLNAFRPQFYKFMLEGTLVHCRKLYNSGMVYEACDILMDFTGKKQTEVLRILEE